MAVTAPEDTRRGHVPALDGYRGVGLVGMLLYHHGAPWGRGFVFTISTFFTLSGFLITSLLYSERIATGTVNLRAFWVRRFRRLLPAALVTLALIVVFGVVAADAAQRASLRGDVLAALGYVANWRFIFTGQSYLEQFSTPSPVLHFWSLAIEEQFYLLFPLLFVAMAWRSGTEAQIRRRLLGGIAALSVASVSLPLVMTLTKDRVYLGTDTRAAEILLGCGLAVLLSRQRLGDNMAPGRLRSTLRILGPLAVGGVLAVWLTASRTAEWIYHGGFGAYAVLSCVVVAACTDPANLVSRIFSPRVLVWLGQRSYGIYLLHFPLFMVMSPHRIPIGFWPLFAVRVGVCLICAELMFRLVEQPFRWSRPAVRVPLWGVAPALSMVIVVSLALTTSHVTVGTAQIVASNPNALRIDPANIDTSPIRQSNPSPVAPPSVSRLTATSEAPFSFNPVDVPMPARPLRLLVVGDSSATFLAFALNGWASRHPGTLQVAGYGLLGCGLLTGGTEVVGGSERTFAPACDEWPQTWMTAMSETQPDLIMVAGAFHDATDRRFGPTGPLEHVGEPAFDGRLAGVYDKLVTLLSNAGAPIVWLDNPPVFDGINLADRSVGSPANDPLRMKRINELLSELATRHDNVAIVHYAQFFENWPRGPADQLLRADGLHVDYFGREPVSNWLAPQLLAAFWHAHTT